MKALGAGAPGGSSTAGHADAAGIIACRSIRRARSAVGEYGRSGKFKSEAGRRYRLVHVAVKLEAVP
jgi:hypothetical protein